MSKSFLYKMNGGGQSDFKQLIDGLTDEPRIAWYPSGRWDFRALLYLSGNYRDKFPVTGSNTFKEPQMPDLFLFTDADSDFLNTALNQREMVKPKTRIAALISNAADLGGWYLYNDGRTKIRVMCFEHLTRVNCSSDKRISGNLANKEDEGKAVYMELRVTSKLLGTFRVPVLYINTENESFCANELIGKASVSHIIHVRYGGLGRGGLTSGAWLKNVLKELNTELYITDEQYACHRGDKAVIELYPHLDGKEPLMTTCYSVLSKYWSNHGNVKWKFIH